MQTQSRHRRELSQTKAYQKQILDLATFRMHEQGRSRKPLFINVIVLWFVALR